MSLYTTSLFVHILGSFTFFSGIILEWGGLTQLKKATRSENVLLTLRWFRPLRTMQPTSGAAIILSGLYMSYAKWGFQAWIVVSLLTVLGLAATGRSVTGRRLARIGQTASKDTGEISEGLRKLLNDPVLYVSHNIRIGLVLAIIALMVFKPGPTGVALWMAGALLIALILRATTRR